MGHKLCQPIKGVEGLGFTAILGGINNFGRSIGSVDGWYLDHAFLGKAGAHDVTRQILDGLGASGQMVGPQ
jgi:hypothetical protein